MNSSPQYVRTRAFFMKLLCMTRVLLMNNLRCQDSEGTLSKRHVVAALLDSVNAPNLDGMTTYIQIILSKRRMYITSLAGTEYLLKPHRMLRLY